MKECLDEYVALINTPEFVSHDPVQFPKRYIKKQDIEIAAFVTAIISWGQRKTILRDAERVLQKMGDSPYDYVMNGEYEGLGSANVHRTFFETDLAYMLRGFRGIYDEFDSVEDFLACKTVGTEADTAWAVIETLRSEAARVNGRDNSKCFPANLEKSASKRYHLALRWLVRNDNIVDLGIWTFLKPFQLYIPLDVHVGNTARRLGLLTRKANDRKSVEELTGILRQYCPEDPVKYDFALFGIGVNGKE
ncbi:MAG: TIGR02757 family protein [Tannerellaceae bacterium]|jgi:uncharacterized protein (TIGR02757 family)|nr:TIGR02757 family protein [Tannerellaceae bacterium]